MQVGDGSGQLLVGESQAGTPVNQLRWMAEGVHLVVTTIYPPEELLQDIPEHPPGRAAVGETGARPRAHATPLRPASQSLCPQAPRAETPPDRRVA